MGVKSLHTYIQTQLPECLECHTLHNTKVVVDGNNLAHTLYQQCPGINACLGGDYDKFAAYVTQYFKSLELCGIFAIVIMDGGQPPKLRK
ncbi:hypothetical protein Pmani_008125, partial [Petrolisthes manimaculis]